MQDSTHIPKPRHLGPDYGAQWQDAGMAKAYRYRPPYDEETLDLLIGLQPAGCEGAVLDVGCGTGDLARPLAARGLQVDAIDASAAMVDVGRALPGGLHSDLQWHVAPMETAPLAGPYALAVAGESIHWMNWDRVFPRLAETLAPDAALAIVERLAAPQPWEQELGVLIARYSTNQEYAPFDLVAGLDERGFFEPLGTHRTRSLPWTQPREAFIESIHSRNGFSRVRMGVSAAIFDAAVRDLLMRHGVDDDLTLDAFAEISWGRPRSR